MLAGVPVLMGDEPSLRRARGSRCAEHLNGGSQCVADQRSLPPVSAPQGAASPSPVAPQPQCGRDRAESRCEQGHPQVLRDSSRPRASLAREARVPADPSVSRCNRKASPRCMSQSPG